MNTGAIIVELDAILTTMTSRLPSPKLRDFAGDKVWRFSEKSVHQAIVQKLARIISGVGAATALHSAGLFQEQGAIQRILDEGSVRNSVSFL